MKANKQRFAMVSYNTIQAERKAIMETKLQKELSWYLTLGMYAPVPIKQVFSLFTIILDSERNEVVYYCRTHMTENHQTDFKAVEKQYRTLYQGYMYE
jgi:hypothetical protein